MNRRAALVVVAVAIVLQPSPPARRHRHRPTQKIDDASAPTNDGRDAARFGSDGTDASISNDGSIPVIDAGPDGGCFVSTVGT